MPPCGAALAGGECVQNPSTGSCYYCDRSVGDTTPRRPGDTPATFTARRMKRQLLAEADRAAGIDTRLHRPLVAGLPALRAQLDVRHDLPMRVVADLLDDVVPMLELLARLQAIVDKVDGVEFSEAGEHEHAVDVIDAIRRTLAPPAPGHDAGWPD